MNLKSIFTLIFIAFLASACSDYSPKPYAYPRVVYPEKEYKTIDVDCPFTFDIPVYSELKSYTGGDQPCWYNLVYTQFDATLHLSYVHMNSPKDLDSLAEDAYRMVFKPHHQVAEEIIVREIGDTTKGLTGMIYDLEGKTATPFNFYLTDGKDHFFRGSFYFNSKTKMDSIMPVYQFLNEDIKRTMESFEFQ
jgi:gliding motility-associated lipoprotein GldD